MIVSSFTASCMMKAGVVLAISLVLIVDMRVEVLIIVSDVGVDLLIAALTDISRVMLTDIGIGVLVGMNVNVFADVMAAFEFDVPGPSKEFCC